MLVLLTLFASLQYGSRDSQVQVLDTHTARGSSSRYDGCSYRCDDLYDEFKCLSLGHSFNLSLGFLALQATIGRAAAWLGQEWLNNNFNGQFLLPHVGNFTATRGSCILTMLRYYISVAVYERQEVQ